MNEIGSQHANVHTFTTVFRLGLEQPGEPEMDPHYKISKNLTNALNGDLLMAFRLNSDALDTSNRRHYRRLKATELHLDASTKPTTLPPCPPLTPRIMICHAWLTEPKLRPKVFETPKRNHQPTRAQHQVQKKRHEVTLATLRNWNSLGSQDAGRILLATRC